MRKFLAIIVLGLLLSGCASQEMKQQQRTSSAYAGVELVKKGLNIFFRAYGQSREDAIQKASDLCEIKRQEIGVGRCRVVFNCDNRGYRCAGGSKAYVTPQQKKEKKAQVTLANIKATCMGFGYKEGSENLESGTAKRKIDPSVFDDLEKMSEGLLGGKSITESLSGSSSPRRTMTCFKTGEETGGLNKVCRYDCAGNLVTTTIGSAQVCSIQIQR
jgi:hypothetical protein